MFVGIRRLHLFAIQARQAVTTPAGVRNPPETKRESVQLFLLPWQGEKVADRPDEGIFPVHVGHESFTALPGTQGSHNRPKTATRDSIRQHSSPGIELTENLILRHECL